MNPKHHNPERPGRVACAPYNFVPLPEAVVPVDEAELPGHDSYTDYTGHIDCTLTTESPTYTRAALDPAFFKQWADSMDKLSRDETARQEYARFFSLEDAEQPVIPGSTLRGMIRSLVEIAGYGKVQWVTDEPLVFRAVGDTTSLGEYYRNRLLHDDGGHKYTPLMRTGYIAQQDGHWYIRPARSVRGVTFARLKRDQIPGDLPEWHGCRNARRIWVKLDKNDYQPVRGGFIQIKFTPVLDVRSSHAPGFEEAVLVRGGEVPRKQRECIVFLPDDTSKLVEIDDDIVRRYREQITRGQRVLLGNDGVLRDHQPVFYLIEKDRLVFFGHGMLFRLPYERSPYTLTPAPLHRREQVDVAEAIFGYAPTGSADKRGAYAGRVYFSDAHLEPDQSGVWASRAAVTPAILSGPKPTTFQHYLTQQRPDRTPSDDQRNRDGSPKVELRLDHYASPPPHQTSIRGHKLYWHRGNATLSEIEETNRVNWQTDTQHTQIKPVRAGITFRFRVHFENLRDFELGALLWALTLPGESGKEYRHKVGMGKPLGMGSVKVAPSLFLSDRTERYVRLFTDGAWHEADHADRNPQKFIGAFETYVLDGMNPDERRQARSLSEVERIRMLLRMLEWPGPSREATRYLQIEGPNGNEYRDRPVLPDPLHVSSPSTQGPRPPRFGESRPGAGPRRPNSPPDRRGGRHQRW